MPVITHALPLARVGIVLLGVVPSVVLTLLHPAHTLTESLASADTYGVAIVAFLYACSALLELLVINRLEGVLGAVVFLVAVFTAVPYEDCDGMCYTHRGAVVLVFVVEILLLFTREHSWLVFVGTTAIVVAIQVIWWVDDENQTGSWFAALELIALAFVRLLAAQMPVNDEDPWDAFLARPRRFVNSVS